jgi:hypothetical protein
MAPDRLRAAAAAEFLGIRVTILRRQARNGVIQATKEGRRGFFHFFIFPFFYKGELERWLKSGGPQVSPDRDESPWGL